jgi:MFS family permease
MTMFPAGCCLGALFSNCRFGHKKIVFYISLLTIGSQVVLNMCREFKSYMMLVMGRFFLGVSAGVCAALAPMYLWDVSPEAWRRVVMVFFQLFISLAMVISQLLGFFMASTNWIIVLVIAVVPVAIGVNRLRVEFIFYVKNLDFSVEVLSRVA